MDDEIKVFAAERSHKDAASALEYVKLLIQLLVGGNGLAITALLTLAGAFKEQSEFVKYIAVPCIIYTLGIIRGVYATFLYANSGRTCSYRWMLRSEGDVGGYEREGEKAFETQQKADKWITLSLVAFLLGSFAAIAVVYFSPHKAAVAPPSLSECLRSR